ncbi:MAG: replication-associated recombination protein A [Marinilabiliales bacterium]
MQVNIPLAERIRPKNLDEYIGQEHIVGKDAVLRKAIESGNIPSMILWGPPGVGKTTLARIISNELDRAFYTLSAVHSGVKDVREVIEKAKKQQFFNKPSAILFIDEIHRFNKAQQDSLLAAIEQGIITLIGATTENPSFEVISPLLSRCHVYILKPFDKQDLIKLLHIATEKDYELKSKKIEFQEYEAILRFSGGDARKLLNILELIVNQSSSDKIVVTNKVVTEILQNNIALYDKKGENHYDIISAFIKSIRGSDPNAAVYWLARMLTAGEDIKFIARRMVILAAEDIGLANPNALLLAQSCFDAINVIGMPEARIILSETAIYLATSEKCNTAYMAIEEAMKTVKETGDLPVPLHLRNAPTGLMKELGYAKDYKYAHNYNDNFVDLQYLPDKLDGTIFYKPQNNPRELEIQKRLKKFWKTRYEY